MSNILKFAVRSFSGRHCDEVAVLAGDNLDVVHCKAVVNYDGRNGFELGVVLFDKSDSDVGNLDTLNSFHFLTSTF